MDKGRRVHPSQIQEACRRAGIVSLNPQQAQYLTDIFSHGFWVSGRRTGKTTALRVAVELDKLLDERWQEPVYGREEIVAEAFRKNVGLSGDAATPWFDQMAQIAVDALEDRGWFDR